MRRNLNQTLLCAGLVLFFSAAGLASGETRVQVPRARGFAPAATVVTGDYGDTDHPETPPPGLEPIICFGEDLSDYPPGQSGPTLEETPLADAARDCFLELLGEQGTEGFGLHPQYLHYTFAMDFGVMGSALLSTPEDYDQPVAIGETLLNTLQGTEWTPEIFAIDFGGARKGLGFYGIDIGECGQLTVGFYDHKDRLIDRVVVPHKYPEANSGSVFYFGYVRRGRPFWKVTFENSAVTCDLFVFDDFTVGNLPE